MMKKLKPTIMAALAVSFLWGCSSTESPTDVPPDHTVNKGGALHKSGLENPEQNCVVCHGSNLQGGTSGVSCFKCHGKRW
jgi:mono/diheme cytochrome c family protein